MKAVILAGGLGTRLSEETDARPNREAIKRMKKEQRKVFLEDLLASTSPEYLESIQEARKDHKEGQDTSSFENYAPTISHPKRFIRCRNDSVDSINIDASTHELKDLVWQGRYGTIDMQ